MYSVLLNTYSKVLNTYSIVLNKNFYGAKKKIPRASEELSAQFGKIIKPIRAAARLLQQV